MPFGVAAHLLLTVVSGAAIAGLVGARLSLAERCAIAVVAGLVGGSGLSLVLATAFGIGVATAIGGPAGLGCIAAVAVSFGCPHPAGTWRRAWLEARAEPPWVLVGLLAASTGFFAVIFGRALVEKDGGLLAGYQAVWSDWSLHATTASSFAAGHNLPAVDPLFGGTPLLYPYLPDFHSAMLLVLGWGLGPALAVPGFMLCVAITVLMVSIAHRLTGSFVAGGLALAICVLGGGVGFAGFVQDACAHTVAGSSVSVNTLSSTTCTGAGFLQHPLPVIGDTVRGLEPTITAQPRAYDGMLEAATDTPIDNQQWFTPLTAWWLPQRGFLFGFAIALSVLTILIAAENSAPDRQWSAYAVAGVLTGVLPLYHIHSLIVLMIIVPWFMLRRRTREWFVFTGAAAVVAGPRLVQLVGGSKGSTAACNQFPWVEPGWMSRVIPAPANPDFSCARPVLGIGTAVHGIIDFAHALVLPGFWWFWITNTGILLPLMVVAAAAWAWQRIAPANARPVALARFAGLFGDPLLQFCVPFLLVFCVANVVVFQSWEWDNTKLLAYWQFGGAFLVSGAAVRWFRSGAVRAMVAVTVMVSLLLTGSLVMIRFGPWTPPAIAGQISGPYTLVDAGDAALAAQIDRVTPRNAVFLTSGGLGDPALVLSGRIAFLGFQGWLYSYGIDYSTRAADQKTMYAGCDSGASDTGCAALDLLRHYRIGYAEILNNQPVGGLPPPDQTWWQSHFTVVARSPHAVVYDVIHS